MNQRLVESVAQIILAMSDDERRLLGRKLRYSGLQQVGEPSEAEKSLRIAEMAEDMKAFEEAYGTPLSALSAEHWTLPPGADSGIAPTKEAMPSPAELAASQAEVVQRYPQGPAQSYPQEQAQVSSQPAQHYNSQGNNGQQTFDSFAPPEQTNLRSQSQNDNDADPSYAALYELP